MGASGKMRVCMMGEGEAECELAREPTKASERERVRLRACESACE